uniref:Putative secreted protein n=1 Tax=Ixodes ricinus TaxID=34613 RepID=A0A6B0UBU9_IXORI
MTVGDLFQRAVVWPSWLILPPVLRRTKADAICAGTVQFALHKYLPLCVPMRTARLLWCAATLEATICLCVARGLSFLGGSRATFRGVARS